MPVLTNSRREIFANLVARGKSQVEAYTLAGYNPSDTNGCTLANTPEVAARIQEIRMIVAAKTQVTNERVLSELARLGFSDITDLVTVDRGKVQVADTVGLSSNTTAAIAEISQTRDGIKIKMHDKRAALESLGKHLGLWKDAGDVNLTVSLVDLVNGSYKLEAGELTATEGKVIEAQPEAPASGENE